MKEQVQHYYGKVLQGNADLKTDACCTSGELPLHLREALSRVHPEVTARYYGCGLVVPAQLEGLAVLDLGSGSGQDCYVLSQLVGEHGSVVGVDMTPEQLAVAREHLDWHRERFGHAESNVRFVEGDIEHLDALGLAPGSFDLIVSNCVINLVEDKGAVLRAAWDLLKEGGELYFSDVYADRRVPGALRSDPVLHGECLAGALYWNDFLRLARAWATCASGRPPGGCSSCRRWRVPARTMGRRCAIVGVSSGRKTPSYSTSTTGSSGDACFRCVATPGACCTRPVSRRISTSSVTGRPITACSPAVATTCPSIRNRPATSVVGAVARSLMGKGASRRAHQWSHLSMAVPIIDRCLSMAAPIIPRFTPCRRTT